MKQTEQHIFIAMKNTNSTDLLLAAIARANPALPPRYSRVRAAMELRGKSAKELALLALDQKCYGPGTRSRQAVAGLVIERDGTNATLLRVAFPGITSSLDSGKWTKEALSETDPDVGEVKACLAGSADTRPSAELLAHFWPTERSPFVLPIRSGWDMDEKRDHEYERLMIALARAAGEVKLAEAAEWIDDRWQECRGMEGDALRHAIEAWQVPDNSLLSLSAQHTVKFWLECKAGERQWWPSQVSEAVAA